MNLVREKIKALGAGTAVSNLDLIVTQKSVGDLRNQPEGNKKLLAVMRLHNAMLEDRLRKKIAYFENNGGNGYQGYEEYKKSFGNEPTHMVRRNPNTHEYVIQSRDQWLAEMKRANPKVPEEEIAAAWASRANQSVQNLVANSGMWKGR